jgi:hypothetical protein
MGVGGECERAVNLQRCDAWACAQIYLFDNGLCRLCTTKYEAPTKDNLKKTRLHLTNFAVNKTSKNFVAGEHGTKRSLKAVLAQLVRPTFAARHAHKAFQPPGRTGCRTWVARAVTVRPCCPRTAGLCTCRGSALVPGV